MDISIKFSNVDFSIFLGQKVTDVIPIGVELINIKFENGNLNVECPWRLRNRNGILVGSTEQPGNDFLSILKKHLLRTPITNVYHFDPTEDLIIEFNKELYLDLFADSTVFEQYQLYEGENLFLIGK
ncbi:hypothetical protein [Priestia abyssalis]|uniref:hypothetical protein n=1 Tax=Priestia abyssalis TaxID=1221450 RepID=UPI000995622E|nr:hypothetical protein [Priestia abyssalis]